MDINVRFEDESELSIVEAYGCPQPEEIHNQGTVEEDDPRYISFMEHFK